MAVGEPGLMLLSEVIANDLRARITSGDLTAGAYLHISTLCSTYGCSARAVEMALAKLDREGLVTYGTRVK